MMKFNVKINGIPGIQDLLKKRQTSLGSKVLNSIDIGYTAPYAIYVHEDLQANHTVGQAKFLEQPLRQNIQKVVANVSRAVASGRPLSEALLAEGKRIEILSKQLVPVDTGYLKKSSFVRVGP